MHYSYNLSTTPNGPYKLQIHTTYNLYHWNIQDTIGQVWYECCTTHPALSRHYLVTGLVWFLQSWPDNLKTAQKNQDNNLMLSQFLIFTDWKHRAQSTWSTKVSPGRASSWSFPVKRIKQSSYKSTISSNTGCSWSAAWSIDWQKRLSILFLTVWRFKLHCH